MIIRAHLEEAVAAVASPMSRGRRQALRMLGFRQGGHLPHFTVVRPCAWLGLPWICTSCTT